MALLQVPEAEYFRAPHSQLLSGALTGRCTYSVSRMALLQVPDVDALLTFPDTPRVNLKYNEQAAPLFAACSSDAFAEVCSCSDDKASLTQDRRLRPPTQTQRRQHGNGQHLHASHSSWHLQRLVSATTRELRLPPPPHRSLPLLATSPTLATSPAFLEAGALS